MVRCEQPIIHDNKLIPYEFLSKNILHDFVFFIVLNHIQWFQTIWHCLLSLSWCKFILFLRLVWILLEQCFQIFASSYTFCFSQRLLSLPSNSPLLNLWNRSRQLLSLQASPYSSASNHASQLHYLWKADTKLLIFLPYSITRWLALRCRFCISQHKICENMQRLHVISVKFVLYLFFWWHSA